ncbi:MAG TPA: RNA polymerase sigma factor [Puia sp.]|jgi:RNA polymerase sigma factor (sigma-70 family)|nr:RNA polymerase sigma factor [Puia sp.]
MDQTSYNAAFRELHKHYHGKLLKYAKRLISDAESIVQEVFVKVHLKKDEIDITQLEKLSGLLLKMVHHQCIDEIRKDGTRRRARDEYGELIDLNDPSFLQQAELEASMMESLDVVMGQFYELPKASRRVIKFVFLNEMDMKEYARRHGIKLQSGHNLKNRALDKIREAIKKNNLEIVVIIISFLN